MKVFLSHKIFSTSLVSILVLGSLIWVFLWLNGEAENLRADLNEIQARVLFAEQERKYLRLAESALGARAEDLRKIDRMFVNKDLPIDLVEDLEKTAKNTGNLFVVDLDEAKSKEGQGLVFRVAVEGTEASVGRYLKSIELLPYKIAVKEFVFQKIDSDKATHRLNLILNVETTL